jgi:hypothetical protein
MQPALPKTHTPCHATPPSQIFEFLDADGLGALNLVAVMGEGPEWLDDLDDEVGWVNPSTCCVGCCEALWGVRGLVACVAPESSCCPLC